MLFSLPSFCLSPLLVMIFLPFVPHLSPSPSFLSIFPLKSILRHLIIYLEFQLVLYIVFSMNIYHYNQLEGLNVGVGILCFGTLVA